MASQHVERYDDLTLQIGHQAQRSADLYADDSRRAWQTKQQEVGLMEAAAAQLVMTPRAAQDAMAIRLGNQTPPITA
jgi:hypothetical protein